MALDINLLQAADDVLHDYYGTELPDQIIEEILTKSPELLAEYQDGAETDTYVRELLIDEVIKYLGCKLPWPTYGDGEEYTQLFLSQYVPLVYNVGGTYRE